MAETITLEEVLEALAAAAHRSLLQREVDPALRDQMMQELRRRAAEKPLAEVVADFVGAVGKSDEALALAVDARDVGVMLHSLIKPAVERRPVPLTCLSGGCMPTVAGMLRRSGLRRWAGPFDWMTIPPEAVRDSIADDFTLLMLPEEHEPIPASERPPGAAGHLCRHRRFTEMYGPTLFHVHDPKTPAGFAKLERSVLRMRDSLRALHGKMLLQVTEEDPATPHLFLETAELLERTSRGVALVTIALVEGTPDGLFPEMEPSLRQGKHQLLRCRPVSTPGGLAFGDPLDEVVLLRGAMAGV